MNIRNHLFRAAIQQIAAFSSVNICMWRLLSGFASQFLAMWGKSSIFPRK